jgi:SAM-dependent methyltransferase
LEVSLSEPEPWYITFFERDYHDTFYVALRAPGEAIGPEATQKEVAFMVDVLQLTPGARILDLCCGPGRHSVELARRGFSVTGLDLSAYHLELARAAAEDAGVGATFIRHDMRDLPTTPPFDAVINYFTSFGYLESEEEDAKVARRVAEALRPGGRFLIDTRNALRTLREFSAHSVTHAEDGTLLIEERRYEPLAGRIDSLWTYVSRDGQRRQASVRWRAYTPAELRGMIVAAGLRVTASYGDLDGSPLGLDSRRTILLAEKP